MTLVTAPAEDYQLLTGVDWAGYERYLQEYEGRHRRLTYDRGTLEITGVSPQHERAKKLLARLLEALTEELELPILPLGNWTLREEAIARGLEPDECWYIQHEQAVRNKEDLDLRVDPPPDLALEVEITRSVLDRLQIYAALKVPEVWRFDGESIVVCLLGKDGEYAESDRSATFPQLPLTDLTSFISQQGKSDQNTLLRSFREWVRKTLRNQS